MVGPAQESKREIREASPHPVFLRYFRGGTDGENSSEKPISVGVDDWLTVLKVTTSSPTGSGAQEGMEKPIPFPVVSSPCVRLNLTGITHPMEYSLRLLMSHY